MHLLHYSNRVFRSRLVARFLVTIGAALCCTVSALAGWAPLADPAPGGVGLMLLLPDGTVMAAGVSGANYSNTWYRLTPDAVGSYTNGTWSMRASSISTRLWYSSALLLDGRVFVAGGEYGTGGSLAEIYNPVTDTWTAAAAPGVFLSDSVSKLLPDGRVLVAPASGGFTLIYDPVADAWVNGPPPQNPTNQNEVTWLRLPDGSILTVPTNTQSSQRFVPSLNDWVTDGNLPVNIYSSVGSEVGGAFLLPNGDAFFLGGSSKTALYTPSGNNNPGQWRAGPDIPNVPDSISETPNMVPGGAPDCGACMMVDGRILCGFSPLMYPNPADNTKNIFPTPTSFAIYDPVANNFTTIPGPEGTPVNVPAYKNLMLALPSGEVLYTYWGAQLYAYSPDSPPLPAAKPVINSVSRNPDLSWHLQGVGLNGISEGASYGDDAQMDTNFPLVKFTRNGNVFFGRTFGRSSVGVQLGSTVTSTEFELPAGVDFSSGGSFALKVVTNGVSSEAIEFGGQPVITSITPDCGEPTGGLPVVIKGHNFYAGYFVTFGGVPATDVVVVDTSTITVKSPAHALGLVDVVVTTDWGFANSTFHYSHPPVIVGMTPNTGPLAGGTTVTLQGKNFTNVTAVKFGTTTATNLTVLDDSTLTVTTPAHAKGLVDVSISDADCTNVNPDSFVFAPPQGSVDWTERVTLPRQWISIASSSDGMKLAAADYGTDNAYGKIWTSADAGKTWQPRTPVAHWLKVASSANGNVLLGASTALGNYNEPGARLYVSTDSGQNWSNRSPAVSHQWFSVACSDDGTKMAAIGQVAPYTAYTLWLSSNSGESWGQSSLPVANYWRDVTISGDGNLIAVVSNYDNNGADYGSIWTSTNFGGTWTQRLSGGQHQWNAITSSFDGSMLTAGDPGPFNVGGASIWSSSDSGSSWNMRNNTTSEWLDLASSAAGDKLIALSSTKNFPYSYNVRLSTDFGASWNYELESATYAVADAPRYSSVATSADGNRLAATMFNGHIWTSEIVVAPTITFVSPKQGPVIGGTTVTITGTAFRAPALVTFDGSPANDVVVINDTTLTAVTPAHVTAPVNVAVTTKYGAATRTNGFIYGVPLTVEQPEGQALASNDTITFDSAEWQTSTYKTITLRNTGTTSLTGFDLNLTSPSGEFTTSTLDNSPLAPGATRTFTVAFTPTTSGIRTASLMVTNDLTDPFLLNFQGTGLPVLSEITVFETTSSTIERQDNETNAFNNLLVGNSIPHHFVIINTGTTPLRNLAVNLSGAQASSFSVTQPAVTTLAPNAQTSFDITFSPDVQGPVTALASIESNDQDENPFRLQLTGIGRTTIPAITLFDTPSPLGSTISHQGDFAFPDTVKETTRSHTFTIRNDNALPLTGLTVSMAGGNNSRFAVTPILPDLGVGSSASFTVTFSPDAEQAFTDTLQIAADSANAAFTIHLAGNGIATPPVSPGIYSWGGGFLGQLGDGTTTSHSSAVDVDKTGVLAGKTLTAIAGGQLHTLAMSSDGKLYAWGANFNGQLGNGTSTSSNSAVATTMTGALAGKTVAAIAAANSQSFALTTEGRVYGWGYGGSGQLGNGTFSSSTTPGEIDMTGVLAGKTITQIAAGSNHAIVIANDGKAYAWGINGSGQIGHGFASFFQPYAAAVSTAGVLAGKTITHVAAGFDHTLAVTSDGQVFAWGGGFSGALGNGSTTDTNVPVAVDMTGVLLGKTVTKVACGNGHSVALTNDGKVFAWGSNFNGQLGDGTTTPRTTPVAVVMTGALAGKSIKDIRAANRQTVALTTDGLIFAWGNNANGALGDETNDDRLTPVAVDITGVLSGKTIGSIGAGDFHTLALEYSAPPLGPLETWRQFHFPGSTASTGPGADTATPQNDDITNLMKFALGMNPDVPGTLPITSGITPAQGELGPKLTLTYTPSVEAVSAGLIFSVEFSPSLLENTWDSNVVNQGFIGTGGSPVTASVPKPESGNGYLRLTVTAP